MINHFVPKTYQEALEILAKHDCYIFAGGTDLMVQKYRSSGLLPTFDKDVIYINDLQELNYIRKEEDGLHIGATTKYVDIEKHKDVPYLLKEAIKDLASPNIRNMATLAGNIANASPAGDTLPPLYIHEAYLVLGSLKGERKVPVKSFILGVRKISRNSDEIIKEIVIPSLDEYDYYYRKVGSRAAESISKISFAGAYKIEDKKLIDLRIAFGSVGTTVIYYHENDLEELERIYRCSDYRPFFIENIGSLIKPIDDQRSTKEYRHKVAMRLLNKMLLEMVDKSYGF